jgi:large subunit ribosomal protein L23
MITERLYSIVLRPHVSEKAARTQELSNQYVFEVATDATKAEIKAAVEQLFSVKVSAVQVVNLHGKKKVFKGRSGKRASSRKAYVRLGEGQSIDLVAKA